jgi:hypothetical protein
MALIFAWNRLTELTCLSEFPVQHLTCLQDFKDLFSTLMVSLPLNSHRVRFSRHEHSFTTDEALTNLGSLKFSQSNRMPDPKDPTRIVTTTTTTTFSMAKEMARSVCQRFLDARFVESVEGKTDFLSKGSVWQLTRRACMFSHGSANATESTRDTSTSCSTHLGT